MIYWFTGQPSHGKTVLADLLKKNILPDAYRVDGDDLRDLFTNKDFSIKGRVMNVDAAQKISHYLHNQGHDVIVSLVSPYIDQREEFKQVIGGNIKAWQDYDILYNKIFNIYINDNRFVGKEQNLITTMCIKKPELFELYNSKDFKTNKYEYNKWFSLLFYLAEC